MTASGSTPPGETEFKALVALAEREYAAGRLIEAAAMSIAGFWPNVPILRKSTTILVRAIGNSAAMTSAWSAFDEAIAFAADLADATFNLGNLPAMCKEIWPKAGNLPATRSSFGRFRCNASRA